MANSLQFLKEFGSYSYQQLFDEDYSLNNLKVLVDTVTMKESEINYEGTSSCKDIFQFKASQAIAITTPFKLNELQINNTFKFKSDVLKLHCNLLKWRNFNNIFFNYRVSDNSRLRIGSSFQISKGFSIHNMLSIQKQFTSLTSKIEYIDNYSFIMIGDFDLLKLKTRRFNSLLAYNQSEYDCFLRHESKSLSFGTLFFNFVRRQDKHVFGAEINCTNERKYGLQLGVSTDYEGLILKAKLDSVYKSILCSVKGKFNETFGYVFTAQLPFSNSRKQDNMPFPIGFTLSINI